jgi:hypothetical protein
MLKLYIAGPMSGFPQFNYPAFNATAEAVRAMGHEAMNPAEMDDPATQEDCLASEDGTFTPEGTIGGKTWGDLLAKDVKLIADEVDGIVLLDRWTMSRGARLEAFICLSCKKPVYKIMRDNELVEMDPDDIADMCAYHVVGSQGDVTRYGG